MHPQRVEVGRSMTVDLIGADQVGHAERVGGQDGGVDVLGGGGGGLVVDQHGGLVEGQLG